MKKKKFLVKNSNYFHRLLISLISGFLLFTTPVLANQDAQSLILFTGAKALMVNVTTALTVIAPVAAVILTIYFAIRRSGADEMDQKMWGKRIGNAWISAALAVTGAGLVNLIMSYFGGTAV